LANYCRAGIKSLRGTTIISKNAIITFACFHYYRW
jgi:hypothetical protein